MSEARAAAGGSMAAGRVDQSGASSGTAARRAESGSTGAASWPRLDVERVAVRLGAAAPALRRRSRWLADQIERACGSMLLNLGEQEHVAGGNRRLRLETAAGSAAELRRALRFGQAFGHIDAKQAGEVDAEFDRVVAMLWRLRHR